MTIPGLAALIHPTTFGELSAHLEANDPFVAHDLSHSIDSLTALPFLRSLEALLSLWPHKVQVHLPKIADEASSLEASTSDARKLFENGMGLMFEGAHTISPELGTWLEAIRSDLGLSALTQSQCLLYATPKGKGTAPHFDQNVNFVLQLHGTKRWWLAANQSVENPLSRHTMGLPVDAELQGYLDGPPPTEMPAECQLAVLEPGSLLVVPRGVWHTTLADSDALSLNFTYNAPSWLDLLTAALRSRLALSPEWRATAWDVSHADSSRREMARQTFDALLSELTVDLPNWKAGDILQATEGALTAIGSHL